MSVQSSSTDSSLTIEDGDRLNRNKYPMYGSFNQSETVTFDSDDTASMDSKHMRLYRIFVILSCAVFLGIYVGSEVSYGAYITSYAAQSLKTSISTGIYMNSVYWGGLAFGRICAVYLSKKLEPLYMLVIDLLGCFVAASLLFIDHEDDVNAAWIGSGLFGFFMASIFPCIFLIAEQTVKVDGKYASIMIFGASCGEFIIPWTEGIIMNLYGVRHFALITITMIIILFCIMLMLLLAIFCGDIKKKVNGFFEVKPKYDFN